MPKLTFSYEHQEKFPKVVGEFNAHKTSTGESVKLGTWITEKYLKKILDLIPKSDDIVLATYARSGTTLTRQLINALLDQNAGLPVTEAIDNPNYAMDKRVCFLEFEAFQADGGKAEFNKLPEMAKNPRRRILKTHLPGFMAPEHLFSAQNDTKIVIVTRNPLDNCVSYYKMCCNDPWNGKNWENNQVKFETFYEMFMSESGEINGGNWIDWHNSWLNLLKQNPENFSKNVKILYYENILNNFEDTVLELAEFLRHENDLDLEAVKAKLEDFKKVTRVEAMQKMLNHKVPIKDFVRKGKIGDSVNYFDKEMALRLYQACEKRLDPEFFKTVNWPDFDNYK